MIQKTIAFCLMFGGVSSAAQGLVETYTGLAYGEHKECLAAGARIARTLESQSNVRITVLENDCPKYRPRITFMLAGAQGPLSGSLVESTPSFAAFKVNFHEADLVTFKNDIEKTFADRVVLDIGSSEIVAGDLKVVLIDYGKKNFKASTYVGRSYPLAECATKLADLKEKIGRASGGAAGACLRSNGAGEQAQPAVFWSY